MTRLLALALLVLACASAARAQEGVTFGMSLDEVRINTRFNGSELLLFGTTPSGFPADYDAVVTISGPPGRATVRRKDRVSGIWAYTEGAEFAWLPSFYTIASNAPLEQILDPVEDLRYGISLAARIPPPAETEDLEARADFTEAMLRLSARSGRLTVHEDSVLWQDGTLFSTRVQLPVSLVPGDYRVGVFLLDDGRVVARDEATLPVHKVTMQKAIYVAAQQYGLLYGLASVAIAIFAGWLASVIFRRAR